MTTNTNTAVALLRDCRTRLGTAHVEALNAAQHLSGARAARAEELAEKLAAAIGLAERLAVVIEADVRYKETCRSLRAHWNHEA